MSQEFTAQYFYATTGFPSRPNEVRQATLIDIDLERGNTAGEAITQTGSTGEIFDGFNVLRAPGGGQPNFFERDDGEVTTTVIFNDGTSLSGVLGILDITETGPYGAFVAQYLFDQQALASAGKTVADITSVSTFSFVDHDLSWADLGFTATGVTAPVPTPDPVPEPEPEPLLNLVQGTAGKDSLNGTNGDDLIRGGDGNDRLTGRAGADTFVFGADARDGNRDRDTITDFNAAEDTIVFEAGATILSIEQRGADLFIQLEGDRDSITILNAGLDAQSAFAFADGTFIG